MHTGIEYMCVGVSVRVAYMYIHGWMYILVSKGFCKQESFKKTKKKRKCLVSHKSIVLLINLIIYDHKLV